MGVGDLAMAVSGLVAAPERLQPIAPSPKRSSRVLKTGWPLSALFLGFPIWWALGLSQVIFLLMAVPMALELARHRRIAVPRGFGFWLLFLLWVVAGLLVLGVQAPGTVPGSGLASLFIYSYRLAWYLAITVAMLYVYNLTERALPSRRVLLLLAYMFVVTSVFGVLATLAPHFEFRSLVEIVLESGFHKNLPASGFVYSLIHPQLASASDFLGYTQPRPTAPFAYSNAWGNNLGLYLPFFVAAWLGRDAGWRRFVAPLVLIAAVAPVIYSLNRGLWLGLGVAVVYTCVRLAVNGHVRLIQIMLAAIVIGGVIFVSSPLYDTVVLRIETPHSNDRRASVAGEVISATKSSPILGYASTRQKQGSYASLAGGETPTCHQCAAPPLGTQGFMWRLIFTTGFVGTGLCLAFLFMQFLLHARGVAVLDVIGCMVILESLLFFLVYDSLESPLFTLMLAIGLMARGRRPLGPGATGPPHRPLAIGADHA
jgi:hypothetical protein